MDYPSYCAWPPVVVRCSLSCTFVSNCRASGATELYSYSPGELGCNWMCWWRYCTVSVPYRWRGALPMWVHVISVKIITDCLHEPTRVMAICTGSLPYDIPLEGLAPGIHVLELEANRTSGATSRIVFEFTISGISLVPRRWLQKSNFSATNA